MGVKYCCLCKISPNVLLCIEAAARLSGRRSLTEWKAAICMVGGAEAALDSSVAWNIGPPASVVQL